LRRLLAVLLCLWAGPPAWAANQVVVRDFHWKIASTEHFDIHYYDESAPLVGFAAKTLERSYQRLSAGLLFKFKERRPFFLYASVNDMQQSNIVEIGDGTGGVTEPFKDRFMVFNDGSRQWLDEVASHELTHVFQYGVLLSGFWKSARILKTLIYPLWMMEGMAEYFTRDIDHTPGEVLLRDAATSGGLLPLWKLEHFSHLKPHQVRLAYESGGSALEFLEGEFGGGKIEKMLKLFESHFETSSVLQQLTGLDIFAFDKKWREWLEARFRRVARLERLQEPSAYGLQLTRPSSRDLPEQNSSPVFTPDGKHMAYLSTREGFPPVLMLRDMATGRSRRLLDTETRVETLDLGRFADLSRVLAVSPDGRRLAYFGKKNHRDLLCLFDLKTGRLERRELPGLSGALEPAFSPDGRSIAFSGMKDAVSDLYLYDLEGRSIRQLNADPQDDQSPAYSPDGRSLVFSSEVETPEDPLPYQRRLVLLDLASGSLRTLSSQRGSARDPVFSPDGLRVLFALQKEGFNEIHELELTSGRVQRLTRSIGAAYTPVYCAGGDAIAFSSQRAGSVHIYMGPRARFLSETVEEGLPSAVKRSTAAPALTLERPYKPSYSTDLFLPAFFYSSNGGLFWTSYWQGSDMLGNHTATGLLTYASGEGYLDYQAYYAYGRWRPKLLVGARGFLYNQHLKSSGYTTDQSAHAQGLYVSYPLDRFNSVSAGVENRTDYEDYNDSDYRMRHDVRLGVLAYQRDTVKGRYLVATRGSRLRLAYEDSPRVLGGNYLYRIFTGEAQQFVPTGGQSALAFRAFGAQSYGPNTPEYPLGGIGRLRGYSSGDYVGSRVAMGTAEWRVPVWENIDYYMWYMFPDFYFKQVALAVFSDTGYSWSSDDQLSSSRVGHLKNSVGVGLRIHTFILQLAQLVLSFDFARPTTERGGAFYFYFGPLF